MSNEVLTPNAAGEPSPAEQSDNLAFGMYALHRKGGDGKPSGEPKVFTKEINTEPQESEVKAEQVEEETAPEPQDESNAEIVNEDQLESQDEEEVLSKSEIDLESMSEAELRELAEKLGSRAVARFGELTAKRKQAEEQLNALKQEMQSRESQKDPLEVKKVENNPFSDINTIEDLQAKAREVDEAIEWAEDVLWNNDHLAADDVVAQNGDQEITKAQVRKVLRDSQKSRKTFLPARLQDLQAKEQRLNMKAQFSEAIKSELSWIDGEDNDVRKQFESLRESPLIKEAVEKVPDLEPYMEYMIAHAANSIYNRKPVNQPKPSARITPPSISISSTAQSEQPEPRAAKAVKDVQQRFSTSGATQDFIALRTLQHSKRK
jgi:hypothetical protein